MPRTMVGLLAAAGAAMSALVGLTHGDSASVLVAAAAAASGCAAYLALPPSKKISSNGQVESSLGKARVKYQSFIWA
jgi:hypothetical protein